MAKPTKLSTNKKARKGFFLNNLLTMKTEKLINDILTKVIIPTEISKGIVSNLFVINVVSENPFTHTSIIYHSELLRDAAYLMLDDATFWSLSFNPNYLSTLDC